MADEIKGLFVKFGANTVEFDNSIKGVNQALTQLRKDFSTINKELKFDPSNVELLDKKMQNLNEQTKLSEERIKKLKTQQDALGESQIGSKEWNKLNLEIEKTESNLGFIQKESVKTEKAIKDASDPKSVMNLDKALEEVSKDLETVNKKLQLNPKNVEASAEKMRLLEKQTSLASDKVETLKKEQKALGEEKIGSSEWKDYERKIVDAQLAVKNLGDESKSTGEKSNALSDIGKKLDFQNFIMATEQISKMGDQIKAFATNAIAEFEKFDAYLDNFTVMTGRASSEVLGLRDSILKDIDTANFEGLTKAIGSVAQTTGKMGDEIKDTSKILFQFSELTGTDAASNIQSATKAMRAFGMADEDLDKVLNQTLKTYQKTGISTTELLSNIQSNSSALNVLGLDFNKSANLIARFSKEGVDSNTALAQMGRAMAKFSKDGVSFEEGFNSISKSIQNATSKEEKLAIATEVFGSKGAAKMISALESGSFAFDDLATSAEDSANAVAETFDKTVDPIDASKEAVRLSKEELGKLGGTIMASLTPVIKTLTSVVSGLLGWFNNLNGTVKAVIVTIGAIVVALGVLMPIISGVISLVNIIIPLVKTLFAIIAGNPIGLLITALAAVTAALIWFFTQTEKGREIWNNMVNFFRNIGRQIIDTFGGWIGTVIGFFGDLGNKIWEGIKNGLGNIGQKLLDLIKGAASYVMGQIGNIFSFIFGGKEKMADSMKIIGSGEQLYKVKHLFSDIGAKAFGDVKPSTNFNINVTANGSGANEIARVIERQIVRRISR